MYHQQNDEWSKRTIECEQLSEHDALVLQALGKHQLLFSRWILEEALGLNHATGLQPPVLL